MATLDDVAEILTGVRITLAEMTSRLSVVLSTLEDHERRMRGLERWRWMVAGICAASGVLTGTVITVVQVMH